MVPFPARGPQVKVTVNGTPWPDIGVPESYLHISQAWPGTWPPGGRGTMMHRHAAPLSPPIGVGRGQRSHAARGFCGPPHSSGVVARGQAGQAPIPHPVSGLSRGVACLSVWLAVRVPLLERGADAVRLLASACVCLRLLACEGRQVAPAPSALTCPCPWWRISTMGPPRCRPTTALGTALALCSW
jgi:hypothetical protein